MGLAGCVAWRGRERERGRGCADAWCSWPGLAWLPRLPLPFPLSLSLSLCPPPSLAAHRVLSSVVTAPKRLPAGRAECSVCAARLEAACRRHASHATVFHCWRSCAAPGQGLKLAPSALGQGPPGSQESGWTRPRESNVQSRKSPPSLAALLSLPCSLCPAPGPSPSAQAPGPVPVPVSNPATCSESAGADPSLVSNCTNFTICPTSTSPDHT